MPEFESSNETSSNAEGYTPEASQPNAQNESQPQRSSNLRSRLRKAGPASEPKGGIASAQVGEIDPASVRESLGLNSAPARSEAPVAAHDEPEQSSCSVEACSTSATEEKPAQSEGRRSSRPHSSDQAELNLDNEPSENRANRYGSNSSNSRGYSNRGERESAPREGRQEYRPSRGGYSNDRSERQDRPVRAGSTQAAARLQSSSRSTSTPQKTSKKGLWASIKSFVLGLLGSKPSAPVSNSSSRESQHGSWNSQSRPYGDRDRREGGQRRGGHSNRGGRGGRSGGRGGDGHRSQTPR
ncbi:MAG: hypothetical protein B7X06_01565 [Verrucomicrobia bacterium 21-51-4]|nr:MAG: hypothetical protein B7X06_01565 [Verrucomicrobia bacterium 21-51-4]HQU08745.1 hypothetical protein [Opitutales bacterium]